MSTDREHWLRWTRALVYKLKTYKLLNHRLAFENTLLHAENRQLKSSLDAKHSPSDDLSHNKKKPIPCLLPTIDEHMDDDNDVTAPLDHHDDTTTTTTSPLFWNDSTPTMDEHNDITTPLDQDNMTIPLFWHDPSPTLTKRQRYQSYALPSLRKKLRKGDLFACNKSSLVGSTTTTTTTPAATTTTKIQTSASTLLASSSSSSKRTRRHQHHKSYALPSLKKKLRQGDSFAVNHRRHPL